METVREHIAAALGAVPEANTDIAGHEHEVALVRGLLADARSHADVADALVAQAASADG